MENQYSFTNIQPRCFTCGKYIAVKKLKYDLLEQKERNFDSVYQTSVKTISDISKNNTKTICGRILDDLCLTRICCRTAVLQHMREDLPIEYPQDVLDKIK